MVKQHRKPLVSIIIPTFNRGDKLYHTINSILKQTYQNFLILIIDDGSTDNTPKICKEMTQNDKRITYHQLTKNFGANYARNVGILNSKGDYIAFLDSDDEWLPNKLQIQVELIESSTDNIGFILTGFKEINVSTKEQWIWPNNKFLRQNNILDALIHHIGLSRTSTVLIKKNVFEKIEGFDINFPKYQEGEFFLRLMMHYKNIFIKDPLTIQYINNKEAHVSRGAKKSIRAKVLLIIKHFEIFRMYQSILCYRLLDISKDLFFELKSIRKSLKIMKLAFVIDKKFFFRVYIPLIVYVVKKILVTKKEDSISLEEFEHKLKIYLIKKYSRKINT